MRINEVELKEFTFKLKDIGPNLTYDPGSEIKQPGFKLTIRTADGLEGLYANTVFSELMTAQIKKAAPEYLIGQNPLNREKIWQDIWQAQRHTDHIGLGPIDIALWDLAGKSYGESITTLLGKYRDGIPAYATTFAADNEPEGLNNPEAFADFAERCKNNGYSGFKFHAFSDPKKDEEVARSVKERVGNEIELMFDAVCEYETYAQALALGRVLDELGFFWYEDPLPDTGQSMSAHERLARELKTPILGQEHPRTGPYGVADFIENEALDYVRADVNLDGGITGAMKIARLAEAFGLDVEFHTGGPATLHCIGSTRNTNFYELAGMHPQFEAGTSPIYEDDYDSLNADNMVEVPEGPGLGVVLNESFIESHETNRTMIDSESHVFL